MQHITLYLDGFVAALLQQRRREQAGDEARSHGADKHELVGENACGRRVGAEDRADAGDEAGAGHGSGDVGFDAGLHAQHIPSHVGPQVFAAHPGLPLNDWALLSGNAALTLDPLVYGRRCDGEQAGKSCLAADFLRGGSDGICVHARDDKASPYFVKALPYLELVCESKAMLTGKELGAAIKDAIEKKGVRQNEVARHFGIKPPSIQDWIKKGTIGKDKLPQLWAYFADVAGPSHWGLSEFPQGSFAVATTIKPERRLSESQWALIEDFEMLPDDEKQELRKTLRTKADHVRRIVADYLERQGVTGTATDARVEATYGPPPAPPPTGAGSYSKITPVPAPRSQKHKVK